MSAKYYGTAKVGETFEYNGKTYKVMDNRRRVTNMCAGCAFFEKGVVGCHEMGCTSVERKDGISVYYQEVDQ